MGGQISQLFVQPRSLDASKEKAIGVKQPVTGQPA